MERSTNKLLLIIIPIVITFSFGVDAYVPALPMMQKQLQTSAGTLQWTLSAYTFAYAFGQLFIGALSDRFGRRNLIWFSASLFVLAAIGCAFAPSVFILIIARLCQGLGGCGMRVTAYAVLRDSFSGNKAASLFSYVYGAIGLSPIIAPLFGNVINYTLGWRYIFIFLMLLGVLCLYLARRINPKLPYTRQPIRLGNYLRVSRDHRLWLFSIVAGLGISTLFTFVSIVSYVVLDHMRLPLWYLNLSFIIVGLIMLLTGQLTGRLSQRVESLTIIKLGLTILIPAFIVLILAGYYYSQLYWLFIVASGIGVCAAVSLVGPSMAQAVENADKHVGLAVSLSGLIAYCCAGIVGLIVVTINPRTTVAYGSVLLIFAIVVLLWFCITQRGEQHVRTRI